MANYNELYRSIVMSPTAVTDRDGVILDIKEVLDELKWEIKLVSDLAYYEMTTQNLKRLQDFLESSHSGIPNSTIGRELDFRIPKEYLPDSRSGRSRLQRIFGAKVVGELKSWLERTKAVNGESTKYVSRGWARTANANKPRDLLPKINLADADSDYLRITLDGEYLILEMVVRGKWYRFLFHHGGRLSKADRVTLPAISLNEKGNVRFAFSAAYKYNYVPFSTEHIIGVDVGIKNYATVSVVNRKTKEIVYSTTLSRRVHSLANKVRNANQQIKSLQLKNKPLGAALHRGANSRRKKALAILAAQEIAEIAHNYGNAVVVVEDLSWIRNTSKNKKNKLIKRTVDNPSRPLKYPGRDRTKNRPTPKRLRIGKGGETRTYNLCSARNKEDSNVALDQLPVSERGLVTVTGSTTHSYSYPLIM